MATPINLGGNDVTVNTILVGAATPNATGTVANLTASTGVTAGTVAASKAVIVDASKNISSFGTIGAASTVTALNATATTAGGATSPALAMGTGLFGIYFGSGAPSITAPQGSLYIRSDGSSTSTRLYVNTTGSTTWTNVTTAA